MFPKNQNRSGWLTMKHKYIKCLFDLIYNEINHLHLQEQKTCSLAPRGHVINTNKPDNYNERKRGTMHVNKQ